MGNRAESKETFGLHVDMTEATDELTDAALDDTDARLEVTEAMLDETDAADELSEAADERTEDNEDAEVESVTVASSLLAEETTELTELNVDVAAARALVAEDTSEDTDETTEEISEETAATTELTFCAEIIVASIERMKYRYMAAMASAKMQSLQVSTDRVATTRWTKLNSAVRQH